MEGGGGARDAATEIKKRSIQLETQQSSKQESRHHHHSDSAAGCQEAEIKTLTFKEKWLRWFKHIPNPFFKDISLFLTSPTQLFFITLRIHAEVFL